MRTSPALIVRDENEMRGLGASLIAACERGGVITLSGELGTGKTTLVRGALEAEGVDGGVRSPTYTLVEYYPLPRFAVAHFDLYRLADPEELEYLGYRDYLNQQTLCLIEWPQRAGGYLHAIDLEIKLEYVAQGRRVELSAGTGWGRQLLSRVNQSI
jgi:tRNA threonylcarbamoyladenosine biosynthesis protein TsaE